ncbi:hypothetical protein [uncultured Pseudokineococcus sp.]|uniref:hypothetical protein n=1 Tax=uncultured Pseudokineococcus sp. TaxID=1642928 RepID=UPI00262CA526|nr:hypothetical protein [uncultured Pseudokineococcus sp.]
MSDTTTLAVVAPGAYRVELPNGSRLLVVALSSCTGTDGTVYTEPIVLNDEGRLGTPAELGLDRRWRMALKGGA